jgi:hypothetical protein
VAVGEERNGKVIALRPVAEDAKCAKKPGRNDLKKRVSEILEEATPTKKKPRRSSKNTTPPTSMRITGNGNVQVAGDVIITTKQSEKKILPPPSSIGADPLLKSRITTLFNKIGEAREKRFGKSAYSVLYSKFKRDFGIKNNKWTAIWTWPKECAPAIIDYLEDKYSNTIQGRLEKAASKGGYIHTRPYLYKKESELLEHFGLTVKSPGIRELLKSYFGVSSHTQLSHLEHWQFVCYLEGLVRQIEGGVD